MMGVHVNRLESSALFSADESEIIDTRFGKISLQKSNGIAFPRGLLGMPNKLNFFLADFPNKKFEQFKLLQSLDDYSLSFITLPLALQNNVILTEDLTHACKELGISVDNLVTLVIVSVHRSPAGTSISVNARAPLLIDSSQRLATQYVFSTDRYQVQHTITM